MSKYCYGIHIVLFSDSKHETDVKYLNIDSSEPEGLGLIQIILNNSKLSPSGHQESPHPHAVAFIQCA